MLKSDKKVLGWTLVFLAMMGCEEGFRRIPEINHSINTSRLIAMITSLILIWGLIRGSKSLNTSDRVNFILIVGGLGLFVVLGLYSSPTPEKKADQSQIYADEKIRQKLKWEQEQREKEIYNLNCAAQPWRMECPQD